MKYKFQRSKIGETPAFAIEAPEAGLILVAIADTNPEMAAWAVHGLMRRINDGSGKGGIRLFDESTEVWSVEKTLSIFAQGMAVSSSSTYTEADFREVWLGGLADIVQEIVGIAKVEAAKSLVAKAVRHGGKSQLTEMEAEAIVKRFSYEANSHEVLAIAVMNAKARKQECESLNALTDI